MKVKTINLTGTALDWAVATCEGYFITIKPTEVVYVHPETGEWHFNGNWEPSAKPMQGQPIIEREKISTTIDHSGVWIAFDEYNYADERRFMQSGPTMLVAGLRCYVASKMGDEIEIPEELLKVEGERNVSTTS